MFSVANHHVEGAGTPVHELLIERPGEEGRVFRSYFENEHGEQWIFLFDKEREKGVVLGGDIGWDEPVPLAGLHKLILGQGEALWIGACLQATLEIRKMRKVVEKDRANLDCQTKPFR